MQGVVQKFDHFGRFSVRGPRVGSRTLSSWSGSSPRSGESAESAFEALVLRHGPMVFDVCYKVLGNPHDVQDALQSTFLILAVKAGSIRRQESIASWLYGVALRVASHARSEAARRRAGERRIAAVAKPGG